MARKIPKPVAKTFSLPSPTGGWNARDSIADMDSRDAVIMTNFFPATTDCVVRKGYSNHLTGVTGQCESLMVYAGGATTRLFVATSGGKIFPATTAGTVTASASVTGLTNGRFQFVNFRTAANAYLIGINGADKARYYTGSTWATDGDGAPYDVTVLNTANATNINVHKGRIWYTESGTLKAYYMPTGAIGGAATAFDLSSVAQLGGYLMSMATWTIDAGYGVDDLAVWITSAGEVIVYRGTDPSSATTWALVGIWQIGEPIGRRCFMKYAGDLLIITEEGVTPLSGALQSSRTNPRVALTDKIQSAMAESVVSYGANFGWQLVHFPAQNQLYLNVPIVEGANQQQYVMNSITGAWCNFTGWSANCWVVFDNDLYFGGNGFVAKAWDGSADNVGSILADGLQAFGYFKIPGRQKRATMIRPIILTNGSPMVYANIAADFNVEDTTTPLAATSASGSQWDVALWDEDVWGGGMTPLKVWQSANSMGNSLAPRVKISVNAFQAKWASTDLVIETGGIL